MWDETVPRSATEFQPPSWVSNVWLVFLTFPILGVAVVADLSILAKVVAISSLVAFGVCDAIGERSHARNEWIGCSTPTTGTGLERALDPRGTILWFSLMVIFLTCAVVVGGSPALGAMPFVVSYAVFTFRWRTTGLIFVVSMAVVVGVPMAAGMFREFWFLPLIVTSVGGASALLRISVDRAIEYNELQSELAMSEERSRVARDVHDVLGHSLTAIVLKTQVTDALLAEVADGDDVDQRNQSVAAARAQLAEMQAVSRQALAEIRSTVTGLRMGDLDGELAAAQSLLDDAGVELKIQGDLAEVPDEVAPVLGWVVREAVTNVVRHAQASTCSIDFARPDTLIAVSDDGDSSTSHREGNGLTGLRERLENHGLELVIDRANGTQLAVVPMEATA